MTKRKLPSILAFLGLILLLQMQGFAQNARQSSQDSEKKQMTRAQFNALGEDKQRNLILDFDMVEITDVVNATQAEAANPKNGVYYYSLSDFNNADKVKRFNLISHPEMYKVYDPNDTATRTKGVVDGVIKTKSITKAEFNALPANKQQSVLESKEIIIIE